MAHAQGTSARTQRLIAILATMLVAGATALAFGRVFIGHTATWKLLAVALASALVACLMERRNLLLAAVASAAGLAVAIGLMIFFPTTWHWLPTLETLRHASDAAGLVGEQARVQVAPAPPLPPLMLAAVTALWAAVFSSHALAFRAGSPLLSLLPPAALVAFADTVLEDFVKPWYGVVFLVAALAVIFADSLRRVQGWGPIWEGPGSRARLSATASRGARKVAVATVAVAAMVPVIVPGFGSKAVFDLSSTGGDDRVRIDPLVSIQASLQRSDPREVFTVQTNRPSYWRMMSLPEFDGTSFRPAGTEQDRSIGPDTQLILTTDDTDLITQTFQVTSDLDLSELGLPVAYPPTNVDAPGISLEYDADTGTIATGELDAGTRYHVASLPIVPTPAALETEVFLEPSQNARYTQLPSDLPPEIADLAREWTAGAQSDYERVLAIQDHLNDESVFTYDENVPARDDSFTLLDFLTVTHAGFCQQFASAMAVMLRTLGIPARLALGFTAGDWNPDTHTTTVTTDDAHAWVEVLFPTFGWLAFEPTPHRINPIALPYTNPGVDCSTTPFGCGDASPAGPGGTADGTAGTGNLPGQLRQLITKEQLQGTQVGSRIGPLPGSEPASILVPTGRTLARGWILLVLALMGLVLAAIPPARAAGRRTRLRRASHEPRRLILATYDVFTERAADLGYARTPGETLHEYRGRLAATGTMSDGHLDRLTTIAGRAAYSADDPDRDDARAATQAADTTLRDLRTATPIARRLLGLYRLPR
jgi:transglutaminase-like putative cysteine protease